MCGRYDLNEHPAVIMLQMELGILPELRPRYNIAPSQSALVVRLDKDGRREGALLRWGLIPFWAKDEKIAYKTINARAETVATAPAFRATYERRRCIRQGLRERRLRNFRVVVGLKTQPPAIRKSEKPAQPHHGMLTSV